MTIEDWYILLEQTPADWQLRREFSDWLEEQGLQELAEGQRYQVEKEVHPYCNTILWAWYNWLKNGRDFHGNLDRSKLDKELMNCLDGKNRHISRYVYVVYESLQEAERDLAHALTKCLHCRGKGGELEDTGGTLPWGESVELWCNCPECSGTGKAKK